MSISKNKARYFMLTENQFDVWKRICRHCEENNTDHFGVTDIEIKTSPSDRSMVITYLKLFVKIGWIKKSPIIIGKYQVLRKETFPEDEGVWGYDEEENE